jgi:r-opsin
VKKISFQLKSEKMSNETRISVMALKGGGRLLGWNLEQEELALLHPHWQSFEAPPFYYHLLLGIIYFFLMCASTLGNGIVIWIFTT